MTVLGTNLVTSLYTVDHSEYNTKNHKKFNVDISMYHTSILHKRFYKIMFEAEAGRKNQSGVKSGACTL